MQYRVRMGSKEIRKLSNQQDSIQSKIAQLGADKVKAEMVVNKREYAALQLRLAAWSMEDVHLNLKGCVRQQWHSIHLARHSVYHFVQTLQSYVMNQLLTLSWQELLTELKKRARSLDDLYEVHSSYIRRAKSRLLLNPKSAALIKIIRDVLGLALKFRSLLVASDYVYTPVLQSQVKALSTKFREYAKFLRLGNTL